MSNWQHYPSCLTGRSSSAAELDAHRRKLIQDAPRLFAGQGEIEAWFHNGQGNEPTTGIFQQENTEMDRDCMYFICQQSSWGRLETSLQSAQRLFTAYSVSPVILDAINSFGAKVTGDDDPFFNLRSYELIRSTNDSGQSCFEICYLLRYFERHGRNNLKDQWSLRQMAVYQKYNIDRKRSVWIFVRPFKRFQDALWNEFSRPGQTTHPLAFHACVLGLEATNWRWYLNDLRRTISTFAEKAKYSSVKPKSVDYDTSFKDCQRLQIASEKLSVAQEVLSANSAIATLIHGHSTDFVQHSNENSINESSRDVFNRMESYLTRLHSFTLTAAALQRQARGIERLLSQLLSYKTVYQLNDHVSALRTLTTQVHDQSITLKKLTAESRNDSRSMKIVTFVATIYLPANLIAQIFSTPLIQLPNVNPSPKFFSVHSSIWIYIICTILLSMMTLFATRIAGRRKIFLVFD